MKGELRVSWELAGQPAERRQRCTGRRAVAAPCCCSVVWVFGQNTKGHLLPSLLSVLSLNMKLAKVQQESLLGCAEFLRERSEHLN